MRGKKDQQPVLGAGGLADDTAQQALDFALGGLLVQQRGDILRWKAHRGQGLRHALGIIDGVVQRRDVPIAQTVHSHHHGPALAIEPRLGSRWLREVDTTFRLHLRRDLRHPALAAIVEQDFVPSLPALQKRQRRPLR